MDRPLFIDQIHHALRIHPIVALLGPRQCGKTTLARAFGKGAGGPVALFDLEDPTSRARLADPMLALDSLRGLVVIDEIQREPELFPILRVLADRPRKIARFLILGSASRDLIRQSSESLAGRIQHLEITPFRLSETGASRMQRLWLRGGFPRSFLARSDSDSMAWRKQFISTFLERDIPTLGIQIQPESLRRFWLMLSHYHGQRLNSSEIGRSLALSDATVRRYADILSGTFMIRQLTPWFENISKRQVRAPKIYFRDTGILHWFLGTADRDALMGHPKLGASWEGFALEEVIRASGAEPEEVFYWSSHGEAELDLMLVRGGGKHGFEFKYSSAPRFTRAMKIAMEDLKIRRLDVVYPGRETFPLAEGVRAIGLHQIVSQLRTGR